MGCISHKHIKPQDRGPSTQSKPGPKPQPHLKDPGIVKPIQQFAPQNQQHGNAKHPQIQQTTILSFQQPKSSPKAQNHYQYIQNNTPIQIKVSPAAIDQAQLNPQIITNKAQQKNRKLSGSLVDIIITQQGSKQDKNQLIEISGQNLISKNPKEKVEATISQDRRVQSLLPPSLLCTPAKEENKQGKFIVKDQPQLEFQKLISGQKLFGGMIITNLPKQDNQDIEQGFNNMSRIKQVVPSDSKIPHQNKTALQAQKQSVLKDNKKVSQLPLSPPSNLPIYSRIPSKGSEINPNDFVIQVHSVCDENLIMQSQYVHNQEIGAPIQGLLWRSSKLAIIS